MLTIGDITMKQHIIATILILATLTCVAVAADTPCMLCDFETGENTNSPIGGGTGYFMYPHEGTSHLPVVSPGADGSDYCVEYATLANTSAIYSFYIDNPDVRTLIEEANGANRFKAWVKIPVGHEQTSDWNFHFGTYTRDPEIPSNIQGTHYYHYYNLPGSDYWTVIIANDHPQHRTGNRTSPEVNPTAPGWDYYDGFTRFYLQCCGKTYPPLGTWSWYIDEVEFYHEPEPENSETITSLSCSYFGAGHFQINWHGKSLHDHSVQHYEVRYSTSPITNANYDSATIAPGCSDLSLVPGSYNWMKADFTTPIANGTAYFAIKDMKTGHDTYITKIDYPLPNTAKVCGDMNEDHNIDMIDLILLVKCVVSGTPVDPCIGDTDGNGYLNILDVLMLMRHIADAQQYPLNCPCNPSIS